MIKVRMKTDRIWEIDFLRGVALILMIYFHLIYDLKEIYNFDIDYTSGFNAFTGRAAGTMFIFLSGISCTLSRSNIKRGLKILGLGLVITAATYFYDPDMVVVFGILHFLGSAILIYEVLKKLDAAVLAIIAVIIYSSGNLVGKIPMDTNILFFLGITSGNFISSDYYPLIPWLGLFLFGVAAGKLLYKDKKSLLKFSFGNNVISALGRKTLIIYLLHQPVILLILEVVKKI